MKFWRELVKIIILLLFTVIKFIIALIRNIVWIPYYILDLIHRYIKYIIYYLNKKYILFEWTDKAGLVEWTKFNISRGARPI